MTCPTCDQLRTLYERERAKNAKMEKVVEAATEVDDMCLCGHDGDHEDCASCRLNKALAELEAGR